MNEQNKTSELIEKLRRVCARAYDHDMLDAMEIFDAVRLAILVEKAKEKKDE